MLFKDQLFLASQYAAPHHLVSRLMGLAADCRTPAIKNWMISRFVRRYGVDMGEALVQDPLAYYPFNQFFTPQLKPGARPLHTAPHPLLLHAHGPPTPLAPLDHDPQLPAHA